MSQPFTPPVTSHGKVALYFGLRAGLLLGIAQSILIIYNHFGSGDTFSLFQMPLSLLLWISAFLGAGYLTARQIGKTSSGTLAGLWTGLIGGGITAAALLFETLSYYWGYYDLATILAVIAGALTGLILLVLFALCVGCGLGALGGLIGQSFATRAPASPFPHYQPPTSSQQHEPPQQQQTK